MSAARGIRPISILGLLGLVAAILAVPASHAVASTCMAHDGVRSGAKLQRIINRASTGDVITITGTCVGNFSIPGSGSATSLTLRAKKTATLDANGEGLSVLLVGPGTSVTIKNLAITGGNNVYYGGGIQNNGGNVTLSGTTKVIGNRAHLGGGGIYNLGTLTMKDTSQVTANSAPYYPGYGGGYGGGIENDGAITMKDMSKVTGNTARYQGGGILNVENQGGTLTMTDNSRVTGNTAGGGGGIYNGAGTVTMKNASKVTGNTATGSGGGIYNWFGTLVGANTGGHVRSNTPDNIYYFP